MTWKLTVRHTSKVDRQKFAILDDALAETRRRLHEIHAQGDLPPISALREFAPGQRVHARFEFDGPGVFRGRKGGVDLMGDGSIVVYTGSIRKEPLEARTLDESIERLREAFSA